MYIRVARVEDAQDLLNIYSYYVLETAITFEYEVPSLDEFKNRIKNTLEKYPYIVAIENDKIVGYAYVSTFKGRKAYDWSVETSIYVDRACKKSGIGKALYNQLEIYCRKMNIKNLYACISCPIVENEYLDSNSIQFHQHLGYELVGTFHNCAFKFGQWFHMVWMEKMIGEHTESTKNIKYFNEIEY